MIGQTVSHYRIIDKLGEGGMGVVYRALDTTLDRHVAIKFLPAGFESDENARERFVREAKAASALNHSNIAVVHEIDQAPDGQMFIVMAYYEGETLKTRIDRGPVPVEEAVDMVSQVASGLAKAHEKNIFHRDIKPANILLTDEGEPKLADFGLAKASGQATLTKTGTTLGTVAYMSPEQAKGGVLDPRSDVFSLGVVLYELLTGRLPFEADMEAAILYLIVNEDPVPIVSHRPELDQDLQHIVDKALAKDPDARYSSARDFSEDLKNWQSGRRVVPARKKHGRSRMKPLLWAGIVIVIAAALYGVYTQLPPPQPSGPEITSLAVLPFRNAITDTTQQFLAESIYDEVNARLGQLESIMVIGRRSVMQYADSEKPLSEIAAELGVAALVEGTVRIVDGRLRVTAELSDPGEDGNLWGDIFDKRVDEALQLSGEIALAIARATGATLNTSQESRIAGAPQVEPAVLKAYRTGLHASEEWSGDAWMKGIKYFNEAIALDPTFAPAYAGLSRCHGWLGWFFPDRDHDTMQLAAAREAIKLDEELAEGHVAAADYYYLKAWDWNSADMAFRHALDLEPGNAIAHNSYGNFLILAERYDEGIEHLQRAKDLDPLSWEANRELGLGYLNSHRYDEGIDYLLDLRTRFPDEYFTELFLAECYSAKGLHEEAFEVLENLHADEENENWKLDYPALYARAGDSDEALRILDEMKSRGFGSSTVYPAEFLVYAALARYDEAFAVAESLYVKFPIHALFLTVVPLPADLLADPRYQEFLDHFGL